MPVQAPKMVQAGFALVLLFVAVSIPAGMYSRQHLGLAMANVDWIHGPCELILSISNMLVVLGLAGSIAASRRHPDEQRERGGSGEDPS